MRRSRAAHLCLQGGARFGRMPDWVIVAGLVGTETGNSIGVEISRDTNRAMSRPDLSPPANDRFLLKYSSKEQGEFPLQLWCLPALLQQPGCMTLRRGCARILRSRGPRQFGPRPSPEPRRLTRHHSRPSHPLPRLASVALGAPRPERDRSALDHQRHTRGGLCGQLSSHQRTSHPYRRRSSFAHSSDCAGARPRLPVPIGPGCLVAAVLNARQNPPQPGDTETGSRAFAGGRRTSLRSPAKSAQTP